MDLGLRDATAVVTGGSSGMGRAAAECLAADGARVAVFARRKAELDETVAALREADSPDPVGLSGDVTDAAAIDSAFAGLVARWGALHILVNTIGPGDTGTIDTLTDEAWQRSFDLGLMSAVRCTRAARSACAGSARRSRTSSRARGWSGLDPMALACPLDGVESRRRFVVCRAGCHTEGGWSSSGSSVCWR